jgi:tetratricopeptide (TPR) repeat protein
MGRWEEGIEDLERSLAIDPHSVGTLSTLGAASGRLRDFEAADSYFRLALAIDPSLSDVHMRRATLSLKWGKGAAGARAALESGYARGAGTPIMLAFRHRQLARVVGDWALEWQVRQRLAGGSDLTDVALERRKLDEADRLMTYAIEVGRDDPPAGAQIARNIGAWYAVRGLKAEADAAYGHAVSLFEDRLEHADIGWEGVPYEQLFLAAAYAGEGRVEEARRQAHAVLGAFPEERDALTSAYLRVSIAEILTSIGDHDEAIALLRYELGRPSPVTPALLDVDPVWRPLDGRTEFESLRAGNR